MNNLDGVKMRKIIIFVGADLSGKTGFAKFLAKALNYQYRHLNNKSDNSYLAYKERLLEEPSVGFNGIIYDRFFQCEVAYSKVFGRQKAFSDVEETLLQELTKEKAEVFYFYHSNLAEIERRLCVRGEDFIKMTHLPLLKKEYDLQFEKYPCSRIEFNMFEPFNEADVVYGLKPSCV